ncbi:MAG: hypothetical protein O7C56_02785, partial [Rickettsia endosymbiont of Ixodes persulcatus]|nr:hypothetical protein [Rickettsia endosymbiont of Ixodes persulcatus]
MTYLIKSKNNSTIVVPYYSNHQILIFTALLGLNRSRSYYTNATNKDNISIVPVRSYLNADTDKFT